MGGTFNTCEVPDLLGHCAAIRWDSFFVSNESGLTKAFKFWISITSSLPSILNKESMSIWYFKRVEMVGVCVFMGLYVL